MKYELGVRKEEVFFGGVPSFIFVCNIVISLKKYLRFGV